MVLNCFYVSVLRTVFRGSSVVKFLTTYTRCSLCPTVFYLGYALGPESLSLLVFVRCPQLLQEREIYSGNTIDHWRNPTTKQKLLELANPWICSADFYVCFIGRP